MKTILLITDSQSHSLNITLSQGYIPCINDTPLFDVNTYEVAPWFKVC